MTTAVADPAREERTARRRVRSVAKARDASRRRRDAEVWDDIRLYRRQHHASCSCDLRRGMTLADLRELGPGCRLSYVCPVLDRYRRRLGG